MKKYDVDEYDIQASGGEWTRLSKKYGKVMLCLIIVAVAKAFV